MNDHLIRCEKIVRGMVKKSFPILEHTIIKLRESKNMKYSAAVTGAFLGRYILKVHPRTRDYTDDLLIGLFAHELSHLEIYKKRGHIKKICIDVLIDIKTIFSKKALEKEEKGTDKLAIEKGYGKELIKQRLSRQRTNDKNYQNLNQNYLSIEEIKAYMKQIKSQLLKSKKCII